MLIHKLESSYSLYDKVFVDFKKIQQDSIAQDGIFLMAVSGGTSPLPLFQLFKSDYLLNEKDWKKTIVFWVDDRLVPVESKESNFGVAQNIWLQYCPKIVVHPFQVEKAIYRISELAKLDLAKYFNSEINGFHWTLLGMGDDMHTASIFPDSKLFYENESFAISVTQTQSQIRATLTINEINKSKNKALIIKGESKVNLLLEVISNNIESPILQVLDSETNIYTTNEQ